MNDRKNEVLRITVALLPRVRQALERITGRTGMSKTEAVNRAVLLYDFAEKETGEGAELILRRDGKTTLVKLF